jgi:hypothetical protein
VSSPGLRILQEPAEKPVGQTTVVVGDGKVFTTRMEAESAMKTITAASPTNPERSEQPTDLLRCSVTLFPQRTAVW